MIGRRRSARWAAMAVGAAAGVNVAAGAWMAIGDPARAIDVRVMYGWCRDWLMHGASLYTGPDAITDYPPNAIVVLSPIALVPLRWLLPLWTAGAIALTPVLPWIVTRCAARRVPAESLLLPILLCLCWAATRTLLQFTLLSMTLACAALLLADVHWRAAGVALGLGLMKPHIAGPVALWMLTSGRIREVLVAAGVVAAAWGVYAVRAGEAPSVTVAGYWHVLRAQYGGAGGLTGNSSLRAWAVGLMTPGTPGADAVWLTSAAVLLLAVFAIAGRDRRRPLNEGGLGIVALFCLWSLLAVYHNGNNMILMLPAFAFVWFQPAPTQGSRAAIVLLQAALMYDVPIRLSGIGAQDGWVRAIIGQFDRVLVLATFAYVTIVWLRLTRPNPGF